MSLLVKGNVLKKKFEENKCDLGDLENKLFNLNEKSK